MSMDTSFKQYYGTKKRQDEDSEVDQNGAMLNMLAEVATQTLRADKRAKHSSPPPTIAAKRKRSQNMNGMPLSQARMLSGNQLVRTFSRFEGDELRRIFSFQCLLLPKKCCVRFESFGSEAKARNLIKNHLTAHLDVLPEGQILQVPKQHEDAAYKKSPNNITKPTKKIKTLKPVESENIEISEVPMEACTKVIIEEPEKTAEPEPEPEPSDTTVYVDLPECYEDVETTIPDSCKAADHDYYKSVQKDCEITIVDGEYTDVETIWVKTDIENDMAAGISNYVGTITGNIDDQILSVSNEVVIKTEDEENIVDDCTPAIMEFEHITIKSEDLPVLQDNRVMESFIERDEHRQHKKPKGKAKFIGQSAAEKEMAVRMIEAMKLKQGSSEPLECQICVPSRVFTAPTTLISHYRSHAGIKPYECHLCGGVFTRQHSLNYHLLIHSNKTRFTCSDCGRKFRHPSHFKEHQRRHTGEAPFECSDCVIRFKTRNTYKRHLKTRHGKVLTQSGGIIILSEEEFRRVRTAPRSLQARVSSDKENNRRPRPKAVNLLRRNKQKQLDGDEAEEFIQKYNLSGNWSTNLLEPEGETEDQQVTILQAVAGSGGAPTTVMVLSADNILYNNVAS